jgi:hypothetical protein
MWTFLWALDRTHIGHRRRWAFKKKVRHAGMDKSHAHSQSTPVSCRLLVHHPGSCRDLSNVSPPCLAPSLDLVSPLRHHLRHDTPHAPALPRPFSWNLVAEVLEEALYLSMLAGETAPGAIEWRCRNQLHQRRPRPWRVRELLSAGNKKNKATKISAYLQ